MNRLFAKSLIVFLLALSSRDILVAIAILAIYLLVEFSIMLISRVVKVVYTQRLIQGGTFYKTSS